MPNRTVAELQAAASMWWPPEIKEIAAEAVDLPRLLDTQAEFLSILTLSKHDAFKVFELIHVAEFPANLFLKHLVILTDFGGEPIKRLGKSFDLIFPVDDQGYYFDFEWMGKKYKYRFEAMPVKGLSNTKLMIDGRGQKTAVTLTPLIKDMIAILLFAGSSEIKHVAGLDSCDVGSLLGDNVALMQYVKKKYLYVSRVTGGAIANSLGQAAQQKVVAFLRERLKPPFNVTNNGKIILSGYGKEKGMPFDIIVDKGTRRKIGIEISFQETTNSTIERKAGQAADRQTLMHNDRHQIAYILDGAGNFERVNALTTIMTHSDYTGTFSSAEFERLAQWIEESL